MRILIVAEHASAKFGGEAALPLHYYRVLRNRGIPVWLISHARTRDELNNLYPNDPNIYYIEDSVWHSLMWKIGKYLPDRIANATTGFLSRLATQLTQRKIVDRLVKQFNISVIHQPMPVSPREPSLLFGFDAPVVIGPMNGGMKYPPGFTGQEGHVEHLLIAIGRACSYGMNRLIPGKRHAAALIVANQRTKEALPNGVCNNVIELVENGVDLTLWSASPDAFQPSTEPTTFVFMGRLVAWKAVDLLLEAFEAASRQAPMRLWILGDGLQRGELEAFANARNLLFSEGNEIGKVRFFGWLSQAACAVKMAEADCLVLPGLYECGGAVALAAMSMSKPVIATA